MSCALLCNDMQERIGFFAFDDEIHQKMVVDEMNYFIALLPWKVDPAPTDDKKLVLPIQMSRSIFSSSRRAVRQ